MANFQCWCGRKVHDCPICKGFAGKSCSKCKGTGYMCGSHDGHWKNKTSSWL